MLMLEESVGSEKPASTWTAGPADLNAIKNALDTNAVAINNLTTRVSNDEGKITSQGNSITQLNNSINTINGTLSNKADATALNALTTRVSNAEGQISSQGSSIVSLQNDLASTNKAVSTKADSSALNSLDSKVSEIDGRVTSTANAVTSLQGSVSSIEKGLSTKADASALNNYYTKTEADSAASGAIDKFNSQLTIGGVNVVANSEAPRTSTAATNREYLLYERSAELKAFYDENLEKPITISFEMSVPVAGPVQVYSSNGSAHQFVTSVNAIIVNQFAKYSVTVSPKAHTASTTVSTIEFYGTYGTGRIPTIRKLQIEAGTKATAWSPSPRDTKAAIDANASAISSLSNTVTQQGKDIASHSSSITSLNNSITNINGTLATKADSSALTNLANRVTTTEGAITSQGSSITSLNASVNGLLKDVAVSDTRSTNQPPSWYWSNYPLRIVREFKQASVLGLTGMGTYVSLETYVYWTDASGGPIIQIARGTDSKLTAERRSTSTSTWGSWTQDIKTLSDGLANKAEASAVNTLDAKVSTIDGKVSTQASNIVSLQTAVGGNTSAISEQSKSIDGIRNIKTITIDNNGVMSGYGLISDLVNGKVTSTFGVNADNFYIGPPSGGKKPFLVTTTNTTVNGVTYPPGTWIDTAYIATASIKSAHIQDAAITTAKIADAAIDTAKIKDAAITNAKIADLTVDTIKIKDNAITVATVAENTQASKILTPSSSTFDACQVTVVTSGTNFVKIDVSPFLYAWNKYSSPQIYLDIYRDDTLIKTFNLPWIQSTEVFKDRSWTEGGSYDVLYNIVVYTMNTMAGSMFTTLDRPAAGTHVYKATLRRTTNWGRDNAMDMARRYNEIEFTNALILITEVKK
ncbi:hypothetical protein K017_1872 [Acinetobacter baumannii 25442_1]|nr:hypothetical protein K017_1872 [Acinetobacter baumannii 25442_1]